jgi:hypothetical protein
VPSGADPCHCERSEATQFLNSGLDCFFAVALRKEACHARRLHRQIGGECRLNGGERPRRRDVDAASLRHLPLERRRRALDAVETTVRRLRLCGRGASARFGHGLVRAGGEGRDAPAARWSALRHAHYRGRQDVASFSRRAAAARRIRSDLPHGLDVDASGTRLAIGSTTGALWTSGDAGESWRLVNAHLPPVYAVRLY